MKNYIFILFLMTTYQINSQTQSAEIIFNDGTIIEGYGMIGKHDEIIFRVTLDEEPDTWTNLMAKGIIFYGFEMSAKFEYIQLDKFSKPQLFEVVTEGEVTLYANVTATYTSFRAGAGNNNLGVSISPTERRTWSSGNIGNSFSGENIYSKIYIKKDSDKFPTSLNRRFERTAKNFFGDCTIIVEKLETGEFRKSTVKEMVEYYNFYCEY